MIFQAKKKNAADMLTDEPVAQKSIFTELCGKIFRKTDSSYLIWSFFLPFAIMFLIYAALRTYPFGEGSVLVLDLNAQYVCFFEKLREIVWGGESFLYSWERAMGGEFMGIYAYYIASPLSYIVCLFPKHMMLEALYLMFIIKCGLCGLTFGYYLHKTRPGASKAATVLFSCMYALSAYGVVYQHNTMWIDCVILLPLVTLGLERLIKYRAYKLFTISLALAVLSNFYIGYMVCIYVFVYFLYYSFAHNDGSDNPLGERWHAARSLIRTGFFSAIAVGISCIVLLSAVYALSFGKNTFSNPVFSPNQRFDFLALISKFFPGSYDTVRPEGLPWVYCGTLAIILLPLYFFSKHITRRERVLSGMFMIFFVLCFNFNPVDMAWHGFQIPNWLNYRYSFMLVFLILVLAAKAFEEIRKVDYRLVAGICAFYSLIIMLIQSLDIISTKRTGDAYNINFACIWFSLACLVMYGIAIALIIRSKTPENSTMILTVIVCLELFCAALLNCVALDSDVVYTGYVTYHSYYDEISPVIDRVKDSDESFYRMEKIGYKRANDNMVLGLRGFTHSTSTLNSDTIDFLNKLGLSSKSHWTKYLGGEPVFDALMGIKYIVASDTEESVSPLYEKYISDPEKNYTAYYNPYALSLAYAVNGSIKDVYFSDPNPEDAAKGDEGYIKYTEYKSPFERLNAMVSAMLGSTKDLEVFRSVPDVKMDYDNINLSFTTAHNKYSPSNSNASAALSFTFTADSDDQVYCYFPSNYPREVNLTVNRSSKGTYFANETHRVVYIGSFAPGQEVTVTLTLSESDLYLMSKVSYFYYLDEDTYKSVMPRLAEYDGISYQFNIDKYTEDSFYGTINTSAGRSTVFTTIPYDRGWVIIVDGQRVEYRETLEAVITFDIENAGSHTLVMKYRPKAFTYGAIITAFSSALLLLIIVFDRRIRILTAKIFPADAMDNNAELIMRNAESDTGGDGSGTEDVPNPGLGKKSVVIEDSEIFGDEDDKISQ